MNFYFKTCSDDGLNAMFFKTFCVDTMKQLSFIHGTMKYLLMKENSADS